MKQIAPSKMNTTRNGVTLIYDGECPVCSSYVRYIRLRDAVGPVTLINARGGGEQVMSIVKEGIDLDEGMVLILDQQMYHGSDCVHMLALLSSNSTWFNRLNAVIFKSRLLSRILYPIMRAGRNLLLRILGKKKINGLKSH